MISVIITHHLNENQNLLDWCIESIQKQDIEKEIIVLADTINEPSVPSGVILHYATDGSLDMPCKMINAGFRRASKQATHFFYTNDDIIVGKDCIAGLKASSGNDKIVTAVCNSDDINILSQEEWPKDPVETNKLVRLSHIRDKIHAYKPGSQTVLATNRLYMASFMLPRAVYERIGDFDEYFQVGWEDEDYCLRAAMAGVQLGIDTSCYTFHVGSATVKKNRNQDRDKRNHEYFYKKWGFPYIPKMTSPGFGYIAAVGMRECVANKQVELKVEQNYNHS